MLHWFNRFPEFSEFLFHLGKTPLTQVQHAIDSFRSVVPIFHLLWFKAFLILCTLNFAIKMTFLVGGSGSILKNLKASQPWIYYLNYTKHILLF